MQHVAQNVDIGVVWILGPWSKLLSDIVLEKCKLPPEFEAHCVLSSTGLTDRRLYGKDTLAVMVLVDVLEESSYVEFTTPTALDKINRRAE